MKDDQTKETTPKKEKKAKKPKKKMTKKQFAIQLVIIVAIVCAGVASGFYCGNLYLSTKFKKFNPNSFDESKYLPNFDEVLARNAGKSYEEVSAVDAFVIAQYKLENAPMFSCSSLSYLSHNYGKQSVYTYRQKLNGITIAEDISRSSMKSVAKRYKIEDGSVFVYNGTPVSDTEANWADNFATMSPDEFKKTIGVDPNSALPYIVSEKTVTKASEGEKVGSRMRYTLVLDTSSSVINYVKKIKYMSDLSDYPTFTTLEITFEIDSNFNFVNVTSKEVYSLKYKGGIIVTCSGTISTNFNFSTTPSKS